MQQASQHSLQVRSSLGSEPLDPPLQDVWVFMVAGESPDLKRALFDLGRRGALSWDLDDCYTVMQKPLGEGGCGKVLLGQSKIASNAHDLQPKSDDITSDETNIDILCIPQVAVKISNRAKPAQWRMRLGQR